MKLKIDANGNAVLQEGHPVYQADDGAELALDAAKLYGQVRTLTTEASAKRKALEAAQARLAEFEGIENPAAAREAMETVKSLDGKTKAEIEKVRTEVSKSYEARLAEEQKARVALESQLHRELIGGGIARSKFVAEKSALPADLLLPIVGERFAVENGQVVAKNQHGAVIYSRANPGVPAGLDEALEALVAESPHRDYILKADQKGGTGGRPGTSGTPAPQKTMTRTAFTALDPAARMAAAKEGVKLTD